jgi:hypothetical protein
MDDGRYDAEQAIYEIRVRGLLDQRWSGWLADLTVTPQADGTTLLVGPVRDQAALHGLLNKIRDMGLPLLSVELRQDARDPRSGAARPLEGA